MNYIIVLKPGAAETEALRTEIQDFVRRRLAAHEYPRHIAFAAQLPLTTTGKIIRRKLRSRGKSESRKLFERPDRLHQLVTCPNWSRTSSVAMPVCPTGIANVIASLNVRDAFGRRQNCSRRSDPLHPCTKPSADRRKAAAALRSPWKGLYCPRNRWRRPHSGSGDSRPSR